MSITSIGRKRPRLAVNEIQEVCLGNKTENNIEIQRKTNVIHSNYEAGRWVQGMLNIVCHSFAIWNHPPPPSENKYDGGCRET